MSGRSGSMLASERVGGLAVSLVLITLMARWFMNESWMGSLVLGLIGVAASLCSWAIDRWSIRRRNGRRIDRGTDETIGDLDATEMGLVSEGRKIEAIKHHRQRTGSNLKEVHDIIERAPSKGL